MPYQSLAMRPRPERLFVAVYVVLLCLTIAETVYEGYATYYAEITSDRHGLSQEQYYQQHNTVPLSIDHPFFAGRDHAPGQYRVGVEIPIKFVAQMLHIVRLYHLFAVLDFFAGVAACMLLYASHPSSKDSKRLIGP